MAHRWTSVAVLGLALAACEDVESGDHDHEHVHSHGLTTSLILNFTPSDGGETLVFAFSDPEGDGNGTIDDILLPDASNHDHHDAKQYTVDVEVWNELEDPPSDVTPEIAELDNEHQVLFTGSAVEGPATGENPDAVIAHAYADTDDDGLPVGLSNRVTTLAWGSGELTVTLRHLPPENGEAVKVPGLAEDLADGGFSAIGGDNDIQVTFDITVE